MALYLVSRTDEVGYDEYDSCVVRAKNEQEARKLSNFIESATCEMIQPVGISESILWSFNAG